MALRKISYNDLNSRQRENYNFPKVSAILADYGFVTPHLTDDWQGADFIAQHIDGETFLKVQLKGRLTLDKKILERILLFAFHIKTATGTCIHMMKWFRIYSKPRTSAIQSLGHSTASIP